MDCNITNNMSISLELPIEITKRNDGRWYKSCPNCGLEQSYLRKNYAILSFVENKLCKSCSNKIPENNAHKGWSKDVLRLSFAKKYQINATLRNIEWDITYDHLADLLIAQDFQCVLTGWPIDATKISKNTASLDRIDSKKGYVIGNVQWIATMVNMCKQQYSQEDFIRMCNAITKNTNK